ncbi:30S ribosomal protein S6--L-glutamate ligase [Cytophagaceae bacterium YF14B1]|uniref:30S ribosomal protein S6--L-glutamate ligase n=1 Tax=Xanthocytophaga flava TaxID=3048013 RepID=A0AAE3QUB2_9BACT|nr:30S ribosomal protein S6--L-glutamate ligase [Xanthocytophaga flavus]MDJ1471260.1 30S ribosomal protein S6--L-glutamate ligase [Xanthocytophaga flavus]MDJ1483416.1 30S ribosomal protein S6--L-glutamate ligase [Xanthocytophaga flavus]
MRIAILSRNADLYSTKRLVQAARKRHHEVLVLDHLKCYAVIERGNPMVHYEGKPLTSIDAVIPRIGHSVTQYGTAIVRQFEMMQVFSAVKSLAITRSRDKLRSLQILSKAGVGLPKTAFATDSSAIDSILSQVGGVPVVIKLLEGTQGIGVMMAETRKAAKSIIETFYDMKTNIMVQEFVGEANGSDIRAFVVNGKVIGAMRRQSKLGDFRSNLHRGGKGEPIKLSKAEKETAIAAAEAMGLGIAGVDMLPSHRGPLVIEVNSSPGLEGIEAATGIDIADMIIQYVEKNVTINKKDKIGV